jgi:transposase
MMKGKYKITAEQKEELSAARKANKNENVEKRLKALLMRADGKKNKEIAEATEYDASHVSKLVAKYCTKGLSAIVDNHQTGNRRNMSIEEERAFLAQYKNEASQGQVVVVSEIEAAYKERVGHTIGGSQIYRLLKRHGWRKVMPRSKHPNKAGDEEIEASKKLTKRSEATCQIMPLKGI